ncbi:pyridoxamine 5'-phosphate oxidase family protein [Embleya scabrispora]|uniref:pyridoxamine 5'-phosphate oxidase family protein n=1 Tax=Embleya scabrispora TaxID=159449 RepID=UPI000364D5A8|nr:pyridoxamine 5'-phosphate oxidase family protein [Embleya scabrispora]MYS79175.1 pyridoxamine 5'-phosphate oxidase family protein [Streptomyces sp. SID5474]
MSKDLVTKRPLDRRETLEFMAGAQVGRVVVSEGALPAVHLVAFAFDGESVVFRAPADSALAKAALNAVVAFQADHIDPTTRTGWTGTITGHASRVHAPAAVARLEHLLSEADDGANQAWFSITSEFVTGRLVQHATGTLSPSGQATATGPSLSPGA